MAPLLSVCLITYNHVKYIEQAIEGVLMQKVDFPFELIIADDYSTDGTREILEVYQRKYPDIVRLILQKTNVGAAQNWMDLITCPHSKYIAYFEGDDYWTDPYKLQKQIDFLEANEDYSIYFHEATILYEDGRELFFNNIAQNTTFDFFDLTQKNLISTASCVFRVYNHHHPLPVWFFNIKAGDWALHLLNATQGKIYYSKECMSVYRIHSQSIWASLQRDQMLAKGIEVIDQLNAAFDYKYNEYFEKAKAQRAIDFNSPNLPLISSKESFKEKLKRKIKLYIGL